MSVKQNLHRFKVYKKLVSKLFLKMEVEEKNAYINSDDDHLSDSSSDSDTDSDGAPDVDILLNPETNAIDELSGLLALSTSSSSSSSTTSSQPFNPTVPRTGGIGYARSSSKPPKKVSRSAVRKRINLSGPFQSPSTESMIGRAKTFFSMFFNYDILSHMLIFS